VPYHVHGWADAFETAAQAEPLECRKDCALKRSGDWTCVLYPLSQVAWYSARCNPAQEQQDDRDMAARTKNSSGPAGPSPPAQCYRASEEWDLVIECAMARNDEVEADLAACLMRGWVEPLQKNMPTGTLEFDSTGRASDPRFDRENHFLFTDGRWSKPCSCLDCHWRYRGAHLVSRDLRRSQLVRYPVAQITTVVRAAVVQPLEDRSVTKLATTSMSFAVSPLLSSMMSPVFRVARNALSRASASWRSGV
jgi:hypothetical protein